VVHPFDDNALFQLGATASVQKPVMPRRLRDCLVGALGREVLTGAESANTTTPPTTVTALGEGATGAEAVRILVVEDNPLNKEVLLDMLNTQGYRARAVDDGLAVVPALEATTYDIIFLDCQLPGKDGFQIAADIRSRVREHGGKPVVIIAVTANAGVEGRARCLRAGMNDYLSKPVHLEQLAAMLKSWLPVAAGESFETGSPSAGEGIDHAALDPRVWSHLHARAGADQGAIMGKLIDLFVNDVESRVQAIHVSVENGQARQVAQTTHALKAGCLQVGAITMVELCETLQKAARAGSLDWVDTVVSRLEEEFPRVREALAAERAKWA
jgi:CheY-like chemotaxis protein/HPt (histidine-containing phosphotransfer) domain-containing protein